MEKLEQMAGITAQTAFEMFYGASPSLKGQTITGRLVVVGYGHDKIDKGFDYINLSENKNFLSDYSFADVSNVKQQGLYVKVSEGRNDVDLHEGCMVFVKNGLDYLADSDWQRNGVINLIMGQLGRKKFEWYGQISEESGMKTILPYMAISVEPDPKDRQFFICKAAERLIETV